jgi:hypothetical protein
VESASITRMHPDSRQPNDAQRRKLCEMLHHALVEIRALAADGRGERASDLADAFHNLPQEMWCDYFSLRYFRESFLGPYCEKWPDMLVCNYRALLKEVERLG